LRRAWTVVFVVYLVSVIVVLNQYKVPPLMGVLMQQFQVNETVGGFLMSVFALNGIMRNYEKNYIHYIDDLIHHCICIGGTDGCCT